MVGLYMIIVVFDPVKIPLVLNLGKCVKQIELFTQNNIFKIFLL